MPGCGKSGTSRINDLRWSMSSLLSLDSKCRIRPCRLQVYLFHLIDYRPLRPRREILFESFNTARRSLRPSFNTAIRTVAHVTHNLMPRRRSLRKETITYSLHVTFDQKLSRYSQTPFPSLLTLEQLPRLTLLERKRFRFIGVRKFHRQRHRVAFDRAAVRRRLRFRRIIRSHWTAAFSRKRPVQVKLPVTIDCQRTENLAASAVVLDLRRALANVHADMASAPLTSRNMFHHSRVHQHCRAKYKQTNHNPSETGIWSEHGTSPRAAL